MEVSGEYATWTGVGPGIEDSVMLVLECVEDMNLNQLTG